MASPRDVSAHRKLVTAVVLWAFLAPPSLAGAYFLAVDVPSTLGGTDHTPNQLLFSDNAIYSLEEVLPSNTELSALHRRADGVWLLVPAHPAVLGAVTAEPRDIVSYDGTSFVQVLDGGVAGIPDDARIDSLAVDGATGQYILGFDVPVSLGGTEYGRSDLVVINGGFSLLWNAAGAGVPTYANVVGADVDSAGTLILTFDVPVNLGGTEFLPGELVQWDGGAAFSSYAADVNWPLSTQLRGFASIPAAGSVPDGSGTTTPLSITEAGGGDITLSWGASCSGGDNDFEIYEGILDGAFTSHVPVTCSTGGATSRTLTPGAGDRYYIVVPRNTIREGSYGLDSAGLQRPASSSACLLQEIAQVCQ